MITYRAFGAEQLPQVLSLYRDAGWTAYLDSGERMSRALERSLFLLGAFEEETLVGFIRCVGDGEHILYVQDLLVSAACRRQGIGQTLLRRTMERYSGIRMFTLVTDASDRNSNAFYTAMGLRPYSEAGIAGYQR